MSGCVGVAPGYLGWNHVDVAHMQSRLQQHGFSVARPSNDAWFLLVSEQAPEQLLIRRGHLKPQQSVFVSVVFESETVDVTSTTQLASVISQQYEQTERVTLVQKNIVPDMQRDGICVDFDILGEDHKLHDQTGSPYRTSYIGFSCVHPTLHGIVVAMYSERAPAAEFDRVVPGDARALLDSVVLEPAPGVAGSGGTTRSEPTVP